MNFFKHHITKYRRNISKIPGYELAYEFISELNDLNFLSKLVNLDVIIHKKYMN